MSYRALNIFYHKKYIVHSSNQNSDNVYVNWLRLYCKGKEKVIICTSAVIFSENDNGAQRSVFRSTTSFYSCWHHYLRILTNRSTRNVRNEKLVVSSVSVAIHSRFDWVFGCNRFWFHSLSLYITFSIHESSGTFTHCVTSDNIILLLYSHGVRVNEILALNDVSNVFFAECFDHLQWLHSILCYDGHSSPVAFETLHVQVACILRRGSCWPTKPM